MTPCTDSCRHDVQDLPLDQLQSLVAHTRRACAAGALSTSTLPTAKLLENIKRGGDAAAAPNSNPATGQQQHNANVSTRSSEAATSASPSNTGAPNGSAKPEAQAGASGHGTTRQAGVAAATTPSVAASGSSDQGRQSAAEPTSLVRDRSGDAGGVRQLFLELQGLLLVRCVAAALAAPATDADRYLRKLTVPSDAHATTAAAVDESAAESAAERSVEARLSQLQIDEQAEQAERAADAGGASTGDNIAASNGAAAVHGGLPAAGTDLSGEAIGEAKGEASGASNGAQRGRLQVVPCASAETAGPRVAAVLDDDDTEYESMQGSSTGAATMPKTSTALSQAEAAVDVPAMEKLAFLATHLSANLADCDAAWKVR